MCQPLLVLEQITVRLGEQTMFADANWQIDVGQHWAIIGPNGAGKSVLVNAISRHLPIRRGRIVYFFDDPAQPRAHLKRGEVVTISAETQKAFVTAHSDYYQARWQSIEGADVPTVADVLTGASIERISPYEVTPLRIDETVYTARRQHAVELLGIAYLLSRKLLHLSNGEGRKVLLARALMQAPQLLILDDPFCGLDQDSRAHLMQIFDDLLARNTPHIVFVSPRLDEIPARVTHILRVEQHQIVEQGLKEHVLQNCTLSLVPTLCVGTPDQDAPRPLPQSGKPECSNAERRNEDNVLIDMRRVSVSYGAVNVLQDITWTVHQGDRWAVLGPNGAGKSTLLSLINADNPRAYGNDIRLFGRQRGSGESIWDIKRAIGWVAPELHQYYHTGLSCLDVVCSGFFDSIGLYHACSPEQRRAAYDWMQALHLEALAAQPFGRVSAGEQRLVLFVRALVKQPRLLVLDEPCQGLDAENRATLVGLIDCLCRQTGISLIYVTHHADELPAAMTHILRLRQGRIQAIGAMADASVGQILPISGDPG